MRISDWSSDVCSSDLPYYRQSVVLALSYVIRGVQFGFAGWFVCLILFRQALKRRRERALQDRIIAGTLVTTEQKLAALTGRETGLPSLAIGKETIPSRREPRPMAMNGPPGTAKYTALRQL